MLHGMSVLSGLEIEATMTYGCGVVPHLSSDYNVGADLF
jgi:hypothetical protein